MVLTPEVFVLGEVSRIVASQNLFREFATELVALQPIGKQQKLVGEDHTILPNQDFRLTQIDVGAAVTIVQI